MRPLDNGLFMTREYSDWWLVHQETMLRRNTHIILRGPKKNDAPSSTKGGQLQLDGQGKLSLSLKSKVVMSNLAQSVQVATKSKNSKGIDTHVDKRVKNPSSTPKAVAISTSEVINVVHKIKKSSRPLGKGVEKSLDIMPFCSDASKPPVSLDGVAIGSATSSSNESNASQEPHWKCLKKKHKYLTDQHRDFADLDSISIDTAIFEDGVAGSTMPLDDWAHQIFFKKYGDYDVAKFSSSQKITRDAHQELLSVAQHHLHAANEDKVKIDKHLAELQKVLERAKKELVA
ncbi:hypothetical protein CQW23_25968 [Capsicum baccatum]|uniref:Uncharacterized protein n=1 Tax=Capsicum baccatum TaxID=33114 RepID=A0A2G2VMH3_CAPBA|nr:hypothetical protein CQW23_25968 [Capsicum baccatum]